MFRCLFAFRPNLCGLYAYTIFGYRGEFIKHDTTHGMGPPISTGGSLLWYQFLEG